MNGTSLMGIRVTIMVMALATLAGCGGSSTAQHDRVAPPPPAPKTDVGQKRAAQDAALGTDQRVETQKRTEGMVSDDAQPRPQ
jgi:hypothetical protein